MHLSAKLILELGFAFGMAATAAAAPQELPSPPATRDPFAIFFDWNSAAPTESSVRVLHNLASICAQHGCQSLLIIAHTDSSGSATYNESLARRRARAAEAFLRLRGVEVPIEIDTFGERRQMIETADGVRQPLNRRADIFVEAVPE